MQFSTMKSILAKRVPAYDSSISDDSTTLGEFINMAYQDVASASEWDQLRAFDIISTVIDITTGTVSVNAAATSATLSATQATSVSGRFIQFSSADDWYEITAHTAGTDALTIDPAYTQTTNLSSGTYTIRKIFYTVNSEIQSLIDIYRSEPGNQRLQSLPRKDFDFNLAFRDSTGDPISYAISEPTTTGQIQFHLNQSPTTALNLYAVGIKKITELSATTDTTIFPPKFDNVILNRASFYGFQNIDDTRSSQFNTEYKLGINNMKRGNKQDLGTHRIMRGFDEKGVFPLGPSFPQDYGPVWIP